MTFEETTRALMALSVDDHRHAARKIMALLQPLLDQCTASELAVVLILISARTGHRAGAPREFMQDLVGWAYDSSALYDRSVQQEQN
jgi:hypothetical protein